MHAVTRTVGRVSYLLRQHIGSYWNHVVFAIVLHSMAREMKHNKHAVLQTLHEVTESLQHACLVSIHALCDCVSMSLQQVSNVSCIVDAHFQGVLSVRVVTKR